MAYVLDPLIATSNTIISVVGILKKVRFLLTSWWERIWGHTSILLRDLVSKKLN